MAGVNYILMFWRDCRLVCVGGSMCLWGIIMGRTLPQWIDMANSHYSWGPYLVYLIMLIIAVYFLNWQNKENERHAKRL